MIKTTMSLPDNSEISALTKRLREAMGEGPDEISTLLGNLSISTKKKVVNEPVADDGLNALMVACAEKCHGLMVYLIEHCNADVNYCTEEDHMTPIFFAVRKDDVTGCHILVTAGASVDVADSNGMTPLYVACHMGYASVVQFLLNAGANVNGVTNNINGHTPLMGACFKNNNPIIVKLLVDNGADINAIGLDGNTSVMLSIYERPNVAVTAYLISKGADINVQDRDGDAAIFYTVMARCSDTLKLLLESDVKVNVCDKNHETPLHRAISHFCGYDMIEMLLNHGAAVNTKDDDGRCPLHLAVLKCRPAELVELLLQHGADANLQDHDKNTALQLMTQGEYGNNETYKLLCDHTNVSIVDPV